MTWQSMTFEREKLYEEVWTEPMVSVARRYKISDVGLRKICVKLAIPVPPRGYWAKLEAGQKIPPTPLGKSNVPATFVRSVHIEVVDEVLERRVLDARTSHPEISVQELEYEFLPDSSLRTKEAKQIATALKKVKAVDGAFAISGWAWADISVSEVAQERTLFLLDRFVYVIRAMGGIFDIEHAQPLTQTYAQRQEQRKNRGHFRLHDEDYFVRVKERILQKEIIEPAPEVSPRVGRPRKHSVPAESIFRVRKFEFIPSGRLVFSVLRVGSHYEMQKTEDTTSSLVEAKLNGLIQRLEALSLRRKVELEIRHEKAQEYQRLTKIWEGRKAHKDSLLQQLASFEVMAQNLDRAESLRRLAAKARNQEGVPPPLSTSLELLALMADWLDPLVRQHWPDVDDVPERNPHRSW